jgi:prephenate dehydrogenase
VTTLLVVGTGLIGGSFALAARRARCFDRILGVERNTTVLDEARRRGIVDDGGTDLRAVADADAVFVAVPTGIAGTTLADIFRAGIRGTSGVFDGASVKAPGVAALRRQLGQLPASYVPAHPMAGSERHGPGSASADLFAGCRVFLTPERETDPAAVKRVAALWGAVGADVCEVDAAEHDERVAITSHLPHLVAYAYLRLLADQEEPRAQAAPLSSFVGSGFRDFSRIAGSDAALWRQIFEVNREPLARQLAGLAATLERLGAQLEDGRFEELEAELETARRAHGALLDGGMPRRGADR